MPTKAVAPSPRPRQSTVKSSSRRKRASASRSAAAPSDAATPGTPPDKAGRNAMIAVAAYFHAERRGFAPGDPLQDWVMAEAEIAQMFPQSTGES